MPSRNKSSTMISQKKVDATRLVKLLIGAIFMFLGGHIIPAWGSVTSLGVHSICIFVVLVYWIVAGFGFIFPAIAGMFAMQLSGYYTSASIISNSFGGSVIFQLIIVYALCQGLVECGAGEIIARWLITRKFAQGKPLAFTFMLLMASIFAGAFLGLGGIVFYYSIIEAIRTDLGYEADSKWAKFNVFGVYCAACIGMTLIPYKGIPLIVFGTLNSMLADSGYELNFVLYMLCILAFGIIFSLIYCFMMKHVFKVEMDKLSGFDIGSMEGMQNIRMDKRQSVVSLVFAAAILYGVAIVFIPKGTAVYTAVNSISQTTWFAVCLGVLGLIRFEGKPAVNLTSALKNGVDWNIIFSIAAFTLIGGMMSSDAAGVKAWISLLFSPVLSGMSFPIFLIMVIIITLILTNFLSNTAIGLIMCSISIPFVINYADNSGISITVFAAALMMADMFAFLTPAACGSAPLLHGNVSIKEDPKFVFTSGMIVCAVAILLMWGLFGVMAYTF